MNISGDLLAKNENDVKVKVSFLHPVGIFFLLSKKGSFITEVILELYTLSEN